MIFLLVKTFRAQVQDAATWREAQETAAAGVDDADVEMEESAETEAAPKTLDVHNI